MEANMASKKNIATPEPEAPVAAPVTLESVLARMVEVEALLRGVQSRIEAVEKRAGALEKQDAQKTANWREFMKTHVDSSNTHGRIS